MNELDSLIQQGKEYCLNIKNKKYCTGVGGIRRYIKVMRADGAKESLIAAHIMINIDNKWEPLIQQHDQHS
jgi:hypothetical protein